MTEIAPLLKDRIALVTGASRGIGRSVALGLAKAGAHVIALARTKAALEELDDQIFNATGRHATLIPFDLTKLDDIAGLAPALNERFGRLDIVVHAAGILGTLMPVTDHEPKDMDRVITANIQAPFRLLQATEKLLRRSDAGRAVYFTTSPNVTAGRAFWGPYGASKAFVETLVRSWAEEITTTPIRAALLDPGAMRTRMRSAAVPGEDPQSLPHPDEIIPLVLELVDPSREPPTQVVHFRDWKAERPLETVS